MSRSAFALAFKEMVGAPPLDCLLRWRMELARAALRLADSKEGASVRPIGLPVLEYLETRRDEEQEDED